MKNITRTNLFSDYEKRVGISVLTKIASEDNIRESRTTFSKNGLAMSEVQFFLDLPKKSGYCPDDPTCKTVIVKEKDYNKFTENLNVLLTTNSKLREFDSQAMKNINDIVLDFLEVTQANTDLSTENAELIKENVATKQLNEALLTDLKKTVNTAIAETKSLAEDKEKRLAEIQKTYIDAVKALSETVKTEYIDKMESVKQQLAQADELNKQLTEKLRIESERHTALETQAKQLAEKIEASGIKVLQETQTHSAVLSIAVKSVDEHFKKLEEMQDQIDTLKLRVPPRFKAKIEIQKQEANYSKPYAY